MLTHCQAVVVNVPEFPDVRLLSLIVVWGQCGLQESLGQSMQWRYLMTNCPCAEPNLWCC